MKLASLPASLALLLLLSACKPAPNTNSPSPGPSATPDRAIPRLAQGSGFDYYLLNLSWSPEFCYSHRNAPNAPATPPSFSMVSGRRTPTAAILKTVQMLPDPPIRHPSATSIPTRDCFNMNGVPTAPVPASAPTISSRRLARPIAPSPFPRLSPVLRRKPRCRRTKSSRSSPAPIPSCPATASPSAADTTSSLP